MKVVRDRAEARWLPSRHRFAAARLVAYAMLRTTRPTPLRAEHVILAIDRDQSALENYALTVWFVATMTCFVAATMPLSTPWALLAAFLLTWTSLQVVTGGIGNERVTSPLLILCGFAASLYFATRTDWVRFPAYVFLGVLSLNAVAFAVMWLLRHQVRELEQRCAS